MFGIPKSLFTTLGFCCIMYAAYLALREFSFLLEESGTDKSFLGRVVVIFQFVFTFLSLPVWIVYYFFEGKTIHRLMRIHEKDMAIAELKYTFKCTHCYSHYISSSRPFGYDSENGCWSDKGYSDLYIPSGYIHCSSPLQAIDRLSNDLFIVYCEKKPFLPDYIGQKNPYSGKIIETDCDYYDYLRDSADAYARKCTDPALFFG